MLNLKHLYYYFIFVQELSTTKAAKRLGLSSPALSNQLKQLEGYVGVPLTRRIEGKVVLTEPGKIVLHYAERMFSAYEDLNSKLSFIRDPQSGKFRIGISNDVGARFSFDLLCLVERTKMSSAKEIQISFGSAPQIFAEFARDQFDVVIGSFPEEFSEKHERIAHHLAFPVRLFAPPGEREEIGTAPTGKSPASLQQIVELANARRISLILPTGPSALRTETDQFLADAMVRPGRTIECNCSRGITELVERGMGMGFVPTPSLLDFRSAQFLTVQGPPEGYWMHEISVLFQKGEERSLQERPRLAEMFTPAAEFN